MLLLLLLLPLLLVLLVLLVLLLLLLLRFCRHRRVGGCLVLSTRRCCRSPSPTTKEEDGLSSRHFDALYGDRSNTPDAELDGETERLLDANYLEGDVDDDGSPFAMNASSDDDDDFGGWVWRPGACCCLSDLVVGGWVGVCLK